MTSARTSDNAFAEFPLATPQNLGNLLLLADGGRFVRPLSRNRPGHPAPTDGLALFIQAGADLSRQGVGSYSQQEHFLRCGLQPGFNKMGIQE